MNTTELKQIIERSGLHPNKRLGQNFLVSDITRDKIISAAGISPGDSILEIGPGLGALTGRMIDLSHDVTAVEIDSGLARYLTAQFGETRNFRLIHGDFLKIQLEGSFTKIVSNLPYYCSSEILFRITGFPAPQVFVMLQKELADRIMAGPGDDAYGALSVTLGFYYLPKNLFKVSRESFYPRPEVTSSFLQLTRHDRLPLEGKDIELFHAMVKSAFWGRRKTILKALSDTPHLEIGRAAAERILKEACINGRVRGEELGREIYVALVHAYRSIMTNII